MGNIVCKKSKLEKLEIFINAANITRVVEVDLKEGYQEIVIENVENQIFPQSIRVYSYGAVKVLTTNFKVVKKKAEELEKKEIKEIKSKIEELELKKAKLELDKSILERRIKFFENAIERASTTYGIKAVLKEADLENLENVVDKISEMIEATSLEYLKSEEEINRVNYEIEQLKSLLTRIQEGKLLEIGVITLSVISKESGKRKLKVSYTVPNVNWEPTYDLTIDGEIALYMYAKVMQNTSITWRNVKPTIHSKIIKQAVISEPKPWYIERYRPAPKAVPMKRMKKAMEAEKALGAMPLEQALPEAEELAYEETKVRKGAIISYEVTEPITIEPERPNVIFLTKLDVAGRTRFVWNAFVDDSAIEIVELENGDIELMSGECRIFKEDAFIGVTMIPYIAPNQKKEIPVVWEEKIEVKRRIIEREEKKKGLIKDKAHVKYTYKLEISNNKNVEVALKVLDQIPVSRDPEIEVNLDEEKTHPRPDKIEMGIMEWDLKLKPGENKEIIYSFTVKFPPEIDVEGLP